MILVPRSRQPTPPRPADHHRDMALDPNQPQIQSAHGTQLEGGRRPGVRKRDKIMAACAGGALTSLTMTPFDVVKTRLQTQSSEPRAISNHGLPLSRHCNLSRQAQRVCCVQTNPAMDVNGCWMSRIGLSAIRPPTPSLCLSLRGSSSIIPLNTSHAQLGSSSSMRSGLSPDLHHLVRPPATGILDTLRQIIKHEGIGTLWRGLGPALVMAIPAQAAYMLGYDTLRSTFINLAPNPPNSISGDQNRFSFYRTTLAPLLAGALSRSAVAIFFSPLELLRTRLQSAPVSRLPQAFDTNSLKPRFSSYQILATTLSSARSSGLRTLYAGLPATLWRDVPFSAIYWSSYELIRRSISGGRGFGESDQSSSGRRLAVESFVSGSMSGCVAAVFTNGFDVIKTRRQTQISSGKKPSTLRMIVDIGRNEGWRRGLMKGLSPRLAKVMPSCGIMIVSSHFPYKCA